MLLSSLFYFKICEFLGRKKSLIALAVPHLACWMSILLAGNKYGFYASRFFSGMAECALFCCMPSYIGEITTPTIRGYWGNFPVFIINLGMFVMTVIGRQSYNGSAKSKNLISGSYFDVRTSAYMCLPIPIIFALLVWLILPESPYQLIKNSRDQEARRSLQWLRRKSDVEKEFLNIKADVQRQMSETGKWKDLVLIRSNRKAVLAGLFLRFSQVMSGINLLNSYTQVVFQKAGGNINPQISSIIVLGLLCVLLLLSTPITEAFGRKRCFFYSILFCGILHVLLAVYFGLEQYQIANLDKFSWFPLTGLLLWFAVATPGVAIVPTQMLAELFSVSIKSKAISVSIMVFGASVLLSSYLFNTLSESIGFYAPFLFYGTMCLISTVVTEMLVPETKGKTLEQIQQELKK